MVNYFLKLYYLLIAGGLFRLYLTYVKSYFYLICFCIIKDYKFKSKHP